MRYLLVVALLCVSAPCFGQEPTFDDWCVPAETQTARTEGEFLPPTEVAQAKVIEKVVVSPGRTPLPKGKGTLVRTVDRRGEMTVVIQGMKSRSGFTVDRQIYRGRRDGRKIVRELRASGISKGDLQTALRRERRLWQKVIREVRGDIRNVRNEVRSLRKDMAEGFRRQDREREALSERLTTLESDAETNKETQAGVDARQNAEIERAKGNPFLFWFVVVAFTIGILLALLAAGNANRRNRELRADLRARHIP